MMPLPAIGLVLLSCITGAFGSIFLKKGSGKFTLSLAQLKNVSLITGMLLFGVSMTSYIFALNYASISILYPLSSITYVLIALLSPHMLGERMSRLKWLGITLIITGTLFLLR